jgi:hypothetical protein
MARKRNSIIFRLQKEDKEIEGDKEILEHATNYHKDLFGHSVRNDFVLNDLLWKEEEKKRKRRGKS